MTGGIVRVKLESGDWYEVAGRKLEIYLNWFENCAMHVLIPPNIETSDPELNMISNKYQDKDNFILNYSLGD